MNSSFPVRVGIRATPYIFFDIALDVEINHFFVISYLIHQKAKMVEGVVFSFLSIDI